MDTDRADFEGNPGFLDLPPLANAPEEGAPPPDPAPPAVEGGEEERPPMFPPEVNQEIQGLLFLGYLSSGFNLLGHRFEIRTLKAGEELAIGQIVQEYEGRLGTSKAYGIATVAACLVTVDGHPLTSPLGPNDVLGSIRQNFEYIGHNWYYPVVEMIYEEYSLLMLKQHAAYVALQGKSEAGRQKS